MACGMRESGGRTWNRAKASGDFYALDKYVALAEQHNREILVPLAVTPQWASFRPDVRPGWQKAGFTAEPKDNGAETSRSGIAARQEYDKYYSPERNYEMLMRIYDWASAQTNTNR